MEESVGFALGGRSPFHYIDSLYVDYKGTRLYPPMVEQIEKRIQHWEPLKDDIIIMGHMRCGTNWLAALTHSLSFFDIESDPLHAVPGCYQNLVLENIREPTDAEPEGHDASVLIQGMTQRPRIYKMHLPYALLPESIQSHGKILYITRNPKDMLCSLTDYYINCSKSSRNLVWAPQSIASASPEKVLDALIGLLLDKRDTRGPFVENVVDFWRAHLRNPNKILFLHYEQLSNDGLATVRRLAKFLGGRAASLTDSEIGKVLERTDIDNLRFTMASKDRSNAEVSTSQYYNIGGAGGWKERWNQEQSDAVDAHVRAVTSKDDDFTFIYE